MLVRRLPGRRHTSALGRLGGEAAMNAWSLVVSIVTVAVVLYLVVVEPALTVPAKWLRRQHPLRLSLRLVAAPAALPHSGRYPDT